MSYHPDPKNIAQWQADCYQALIQQDLVQAKQAQYASDLESIFVSIFSAVMPPQNLQSIRTSGLSQIVTEAMQLTNSIRMSCNTYEFLWPFRYEDREQKLTMYIGELESFHVIDAADERTIRSKKNVQAAADGRIGIKLCAIWPALVRPGTDDSKEVILKKACVLVKLDHVQTRNRRKV